MKHNPFEDWIIDSDRLTDEQRKALEMHLQACAQCQRLQQNLADSLLHLNTTRMATPLPGFTRRWQESLAARRARQQEKQVRRLLLFLMSGFLALLGLLVAYSLIVTNPLNLLLNGLQSLLTLVLFWMQIEKIAYSLIFIFPPIVPVAIWILLTSGLAFLSLVWVITLWRIPFRGVWKA